MSAIETINRIEGLKAWMHHHGQNHPFFKGVYDYNTKLTAIAYPNTKIENR